MLRITTIETAREQKLILEGQLTEPWVAELDAHWEKTRQISPGRKLVVDLRGVTRIDGRGESALARMKREGAEFVSSGIRIRHLLSSLDRKDSPDNHARRRPSHSKHGTRQTSRAT